MSKDEPLYRAIHPEGTHLASSRNIDGAFRGTYLDDETNQISGQAEFVEVEQDDDEQPEDTSDTLAKILVLAAGIALGIVATMAAPKVKSWWRYSAYPSLECRLRSLLSKNADKDVEVTKAEPIGQPDISLEEVPADTFSTEVALTDPRAVMSSEEAQQRFIAMILAVTEAAIQFRTLQEAHIEGGEEERQVLEKMLNDISTQPVADLINMVLETNGDLNETVGPFFVDFFGGGGIVDGKYVPLQLDQLQAAVRLT